MAALPHLIALGRALRHYERAVKSVELFGDIARPTWRARLADVQRVAWVCGWTCDQTCVAFARKETARLLATFPQYAAEIERVA